MLRNDNSPFTTEEYLRQKLTPHSTHLLTFKERFIKRSFDIFVSAIGLFALWWLILITWLLATIDTRTNGFFVQKRVGRNGKLFQTIKIRTMRITPEFQTTATTATDPRITQLGKLLRGTKLDELPQLLNVLLGNMSLVGPRPDVPGFADQLTGTDRIILSIRPGITGPATLAFREEEKLLAAQRDPERYNRDIIYPEKVRINREYITNYSFTNDLKYIFRTIVG